jgi:CRP-like cAMP-binding protein
MKAISASQQPYRNCLLASLPASELQRLAPHLAPVSLPRDRTLHDSGEVIETVYFLEEGVSSVVITMQNGTTIEVGLIGRDGFIGLPAVMGNGRASNRTFMQIPGRGFKVKARILREQCDTSTQLRSCLQRAIQASWCRPPRPPPAIAPTSSKSVWLAGCSCVMTGCNPIACPSPMNLSP